MHSIFLRYGFLSSLFLMLSGLTGNAQILSYTTSTTGALNSVATHATGTGLARVNSAAVASSPCSTGFSSTGFSTTTTYSSTLAAVEVSVTPATGYALNVTGFTATMRRSSTGPASLRYAYSTNGGTTWTVQSANQANPSASCGAGSALSWTTSFSVSAPNTLKFRIYGFNASSTTGNEQILNLTIAGTVTASCAPPTLATSVTNVGCSGGATGAINLTVTGGTSPYSYSWSTGATTQNISSLTAGTYKVTVTGGGCTASASATITQASTVNASITSAGGVSCGSTTGSATVSVNGGTAPYSYAWSSIPVQTTATAAGLSAGNYTVTVKDAHACSATAVTTIGINMPGSLGDNSITATTANLTWGAVTGVASYNIQYRKTGTTAWTTVSASTNSVSVSGLTASTTYEFQVQTVCTGGMKSSFTTSTNFTTIGSTSLCDSTLWNHVYHSYRLQVNNQCTYATGTVASLVYEADGDIHIRIAVDSAFTYMLNSVNTSGQGGHLVVEPVCATSVTQTDAIASCQGFTNTVYIPNVGEHVKVTGSYVTDNDHGWNEIHPVTSIVITSATARLISEDMNAVEEEPLLLNVFPNPASDIVNFKLSRQPRDLVHIIISDGIGRLAGQYQMLETTDLEITTSFLPAGIYYYNITEGDKLVKSSKFIVAH